MRPFVLWIQQPNRLVKPATLMTPAPLEGIQKWRAQNRWSDGISLVAYGHHEMMPLGTPFSEPLHPAVPYRVENYPLDANTDPRFLTVLRAIDAGHVTQIADAFAAYIAHVRAVAARVTPPIWVLGADADEGVMALAVAAETGACVALARNSPGPLTASMASRMGVDISQRQDSGDRE